MTTQADRAHGRDLLADELGAGGPDRTAPRTATERRLAAVWAPLLGVEEDAVGRDDHFFDRGGSSLLAVRMVVRLDKEVSLSDITRHPVLADLAALMDGRAAPSTGLLQALAQPDGPTRGAVVGIPPAGGHAVTFRPLATGLRGTGFAVHAVELPGHDPTVDDEAFAPLGEIADRVADEIVERALPDVLLWGHSSGAAVALAVARRLEARGVPARRVVLGAQLLGTAAARRCDAAELDARSDAEIAVRVAGHHDVGGVLAELDHRRVERSAAAYRHDCQAAHTFLVDVLEHPPTARLTTPVMVVVAADDPSTTGFVEHHRDWELVAEDVSLHVLDQGGHHFLRTRPADAARAVLHAADLPHVVTIIAEATTVPQPDHGLDVQQPPGRPPQLTVDAAGDPVGWVERHRDAADRVDVTVPGDREAPSVDDGLSGILAPGEERTVPLRFALPDPGSTEVTIEVAKADQTVAGEDVPGSFASWEGQA